MANVRKIKIDGDDYDLAETKGFIPSAAEAITLPTTAESAITLEYDAILYFSMGATNGGKSSIYINGQEYIIAYTYGSIDHDHTGGSFYLFKGDVIYRTGGEAEISALYIRYFKQRNYNDRES